jgi:hypothetical protein
MTKRASPSKEKLLDSKISTTLNLLAAREDLVFPAMIDTLHLENL